MKQSDVEFEQLFRKWMAGHTSETENEAFLEHWKRMQGTDQLYQLQREAWLAQDDLVYRMMT